MNSRLPLPIARLRRRSMNAKNARDLHDAAYYAWEMSVRLAVAVTPPREVGPLARGSVGAWVRACRVAPALFLKDPSLLAFHGRITEVGMGRRVVKRTLSARQLLDALPAYRNRVIGHGAIRAGAFYAELGPLLLQALDAAWAEGLFLPAAGRMVYCEAVRTDREGGGRARLVDMTGETPLILDPRGTPVGKEVQPRRLYWQAGEAFVPLSPWLLFHGEKEALYAFNGLGRRAEYLDYASGHILRGPELAALAPGLEEQLRDLFALPVPADLEEEIPAPDPDRFGEFRILGKLGEGGMGLVYLARQESLGREVALKLLPPGTARDPVARARFRREVDALSRCEHPHVVKILASGEKEDVLFYAMEYVEGTDLAAVAREISSTDNFDAAISSAFDKLRLEHRELFPQAPPVVRATVTPAPGRSRPRDLARYFRDAARGVHHLHEQGVIHRDIKPGNLMVTARGHRAVVMDLGLAAVEDASTTLTRDRDRILGTLRYLPPEQLRRSLLTVDRRADVYALGATLYELLCDRPLFDGDSEARLIEQVLREEPVRVDRVDRRVPRDLAVIVHKAIDKDPGLRYQTAEELARDLEAFVENRPIKARPPSLGYMLGLAIRRNRKTALTVAVALLVILGGTLWFMQRLRWERDRAEDHARRARIGEGKARTRLGDLLDLSAISILEGLQEEADGLWPAWPRLVPRLQDWVGRARAMQRLKGKLEEKLSALRAQALPWTEEERRKDRESHPRFAELEQLQSVRAGRRKLLGDLESAPAKPPLIKIERLQRQLILLGEQITALEKVVGRRRTFRFAGDGEMTAVQKRWRHRLLAELVAELDRFLQGPEVADGVEGAFGSSLPEVERRLALAESIAEKSLESPRAAAAWRRAVADIARKESRYKGLKITPQVGLVPLDRNPRTGLWEFWHVPSGRRPKPNPRWRAEQPPPGRPVAVPNRWLVGQETGMVLVLLPGGTFVMGAQKDDPAGPNYDPGAGEQEPILEVTLAPFFIAKYEITQGQWYRFTGDNPSCYNYNMGWAAGITGANPVEFANWFRFDLVLTRWGLSLPTSAQWEYACRAGTSTPWWTGGKKESLLGAVNLADRTARKKGAEWSAIDDWPNLDDGFHTHAPVGSFRANGFGLHDVHGNILEFCQDWHSNLEETTPRPGDGLRVSTAFTRPLGLGLRVGRGGSFNQPAAVARSAGWSSDNPSSRYNSVGARACRRLLEP